MRTQIRFIYRGAPISWVCDDPNLTLLEWLREHAGNTGTKEGCNEGDCGACTVILARLIEGRIVHTPVNACILLLGQVDGAEVLTVEDLSTGADHLHPVQVGMVKHHGAQCGFCTPGIIMSLFAAYHEAERPVTREAVNECLAGNLCRCTGYRPIVDVALEAMAQGAQDGFTAREAERIAALAALDDGRDVFCGTQERFFAAPASIEILAALTQQHPEATLVAGATDVGLWITKKLMDLPKIIWLGRVKGLNTITETTDTIHFGAMVPHARGMAALEAIEPDLGAMMRRFGSTQVRASGTFGGNIANGSPIGDLAPALIALGATLHLRRGGLKRTMPLEDFFLSYGKQNRDAGEFVTGITAPKLKTGQHLRAFKISKRFDEDISAVMGAFRFEITDRQIISARIAYGGMAGTPQRAANTEAALAGLSLNDDAAWHAAITKLEADYTPLSDMRASASYRMRTAKAILTKALMELAGGADAPATRLLPRMREDAHVA
jgi:xanthine dehydrogenase small subunit